MKKIALLFVLAGLAGTVQAAPQYARVISSTPVLAEVQTPRQNCWNEQVQVQQPRTGAGAVVGAVAGGLIGSTMGRGSGNALATAAGVITGAVVGDNMEGSGTSNQTVRRCETTQVTQRRTIGYDVVYEYGGQRYNTRLANDPGDRLAINISPAEGTVVADEPEIVSQTTTVVEQPPTVVYRSSPAVVVEPAPVIYGWPGYYRYGPPHHYHRW